MKTIARAAFAAALMCTASGTAVILDAAAAYGADKLSVSPKVGKPLQDAVKAAQTKDFATALADVKLAQAVDGRTPYDDYKINQILAFVSINMNDMATATTATEAAADSSSMPDEDKKTTLYNATLLATQAKQFQKAIGYAQQLEAMNALDYKMEATLAQDYYFIQDFPHAQHYAQMSIDAAKAAGQPPNEGALDIVMSSEAKQNNQEGAQQTLENLALNYNKADSWSQLVDVALSTKGAKNADYIQLLRLKMLVPDSMRSEDYMSLGSVANQLRYNTEAYNVLQKGISSGKITTAQAGVMLTQAHTGAVQDEKVLAQFDAEAAKQKTGLSDMNLAEDYWGYGRFADAEVAVRRAMGKGGLKDPGEGTLLLGMLQVAQGKYNDAVQTLASVTGTQVRTKTAHLWSLYAQAQAKQTQGAAAPAPAPH